MLYLETSVVSYYTGRPSRDLIVASRQQITHDWWESERRGLSAHVEFPPYQQRDDEIRRGKNRRELRA